MQPPAKNTGKRSSALSVVPEKTTVAENSGQSIEEPRKNKQTQLSAADQDLIERVRRKFAEGVREKSESGNTNADDLDLIRLSLRMALFPEISSGQLATEMGFLRTELRSKRKPSRASTKERETTAV